MVVWVKEYLGVFTKRSLAVWLKNDIEIKVFCGFEWIDPFDVIIVSDKDEEIDDSIHNEYNIIIFEETIDEIYKQIINYVNSHYDYYYIKNALDSVKTSEINTIITGSSYGKLGINANEMFKTVNLSLSSQDLYYSLQGIQSACASSNTIKNIVICCGYYYFFSDLSKNKNCEVLSNISKVYVPLFGDEAYHNCFLLAKGESQLENPIFNVNSIAEIYGYSLYISGYFNKNKFRNDYALKTWNDKQMDWKELTESERYLGGERRAKAHNRNIKRKMSYKENMIYFNQLIDLCRDKEINILWVVTPVTKYYREYLDKRYKNVFYDTLNRVDGTIHLLDLFEDDNFGVEDFIDADHLSDTGAKKLTKLISETLINIENDNI